LDSNRFNRVIILGEKEGVRTKANTRGELTPGGSFLLLIVFEQNKERVRKFYNRGKTGYALFDSLLFVSWKKIVKPHAEQLRAHNRTVVEFLAQEKQMLFSFIVNLL